MMIPGGQQPQPQPQSAFAIDAITSGYVSLALVALFVAADRIANRRPSWSNTLPTWLSVLVHDGITQEDILEELRLEQQEHASAQSASPSHNKRVSISSDDDENTPLLASGKHSHISPSPSPSPSPSRHSMKNLTLASLGILHLLATLSALAYRSVTTSSAHATSAWPYALIWLYAVWRPITRKSPTPPYDLLALYLLHALATVIDLHAQWAASTHRLITIASGMALLPTGLALATIFSMPLVDPATLPDTTSNDTTRPPAGEDRCTLWQWMTFSWLTPLINLSLEQTINQQDVWQLSIACKSNLLVRKFNSVLPHKSLPRRLISANAHDMLLDVLLTLVSSTLSYAPPFFLKRILEAIEGRGDTGTTKSTAYLYAVLSLATMIIKSQTDLQHLFYGRRASVRFRGQLIASIYQKALRTRDMNGALSPANSDSKEAKSKEHQQEPQQQPQQQQNPSEGSDDANIGKVVSLAAVDSIRISASCASAYMLYSAPIEIVVASLFLYNLLGWSAFTGFIVLIVASPVQSRLTKMTIQVTQQLSATRDKRLSALNEVTQNLKFVKYYAFEEEMKRRIMRYRETEITILRKRQLLQSFVMALWTLTPALVTTVSFASYVLIAKRQLDVSTAFTAIALFQLLRGPLNSLPMQINDLLNTKVSADRIDAFLKADEVPREVSSISEADPSPFIVSNDGDRFGCEDSTFQWPISSDGLSKDDVAAKKKTAALARRGEKKSLKKVVSRFFKRRLEDDEQDAQAACLPQAHQHMPVQQDPDESRDDDLQRADDEEERPFKLENITFLPPKGKLTLVAGATGSGKSALLTALLGEMEQLKGKSYLQKDTGVDPKTGLSHTVAYCAQSPWLQHATIRQNILFGLPYDAQRYHAVLDACALRPDLAILDDSDLTEIGEKGVSLSGGQQARVALARAVYSRSAIVLLDDPLSAVDAHTASKLVKDCFSGPLMRNRTTVLVTHHAEIILGAKAASWMATLKEGVIVEQGKPEEVDGLEEDEDAAAYSKAQEPADGVPGDEDADGDETKVDGTDSDPNQSSPRKKLVEEEKRAIGGVKKEVYKMYLDAVGWGIAGLVILSLIAFKGTDLAEKGWLAVWGASYRTEAKGAVMDVSSIGSGNSSGMLPHPLLWLAGGSGVESNAMTSSFILASHKTANAFFSRMGADAFSLASSPEISTNSIFPPASESPLPYIIVFFLINLAAATMTTLSALFTFYGSLQASRALFAKMLDATMGATTRWLDKTPSGRIVNKFSRDVEVLDSSVNQSLRWFASFLIAGILSVATIIIVLPSFIVPTIVLGTLNYYVARGYVKAARDLRRLESISRSPIFSAFSELLQGISTVRAFAAEKRLLRECTDRIDLANSFFLYFWMSNRWLLFRLDVLGAVSIFMATVASLYGTIAAGLAGLALTQAQALIQAGYWMARFYTTLEQDANSIERIREALDDTPQEPPSIIADNRPPAAWPAQGRVEVKDLQLRYAPDLPPVLHGISFSIKPGEKVGIVGRTGSGKSTTALAFFRFVEFDAGSIFIDDVDISQIGLHDLRSRLTIIPQNAVLFSGTIRDNLDPFGQHTDEECLQALHAVNIRTDNLQGTSSAKVTPTRTPQKGRSRSGSASDHQKANFLLAPPDTTGSGHNTPSGSGSSSPSQTYVTLDSRVSEGGNNWSQGQRQLLAMSRALLRGSQVILMDEASSAVDFATDTLIQSTIRTSFSRATVITIAHRLHTVVHADKVLVLDQGKVKEFGPPKELMSQEGSMFKEMCRTSGDWDKLWEAVQ
ncbi:unnamed protein product [Sympodiomycopsis kandeliae]